MDATSSIRLSCRQSLPMRMGDLSYLIYRELLLPLGQWYDKVEAARNQYAKSYGLPDTTFRNI